MNALHAVFVTASNNNTVINLAREFRYCLESLYQTNLVCFRPRTRIASKIEAKHRLRLGCNTYGACGLCIELTNTLALLYVCLKIYSLATYMVTDFSPYSSKKSFRFIGSSFNCQ